MSLWPSSLTKGTFRESSHPASHRTVSVNLHPYEPFCSSYYDFLLMHRGGLCDCLAIMGLCLINHVDPLCFTSKAAALRLINGDQSPLKRRLVTDSAHLNTQAHNATTFDGGHIVLNKPCYNKLWCHQVSCGYPVVLCCENDLLLYHL